MWPKIIQVNKTDVYVVGGNDTKPYAQNVAGQTVLAHTYRITLGSYEVCRRGDLIQGRQAFGICCIGN